MASIWVHVYAAAGEVAMGIPINRFQVAIGGASAATTALDPTAANSREHRRIRVFADNSCHVEIGNSPTASTTSEPWAAEQTEYKWAEAGMQVAVIDRV